MYDVIVVGGGPAGLSAATMLGRIRRRTLLVDAGSGRNEAAIAVHGYLGHDDTSPHELRTVAYGQLQRYSSVEVRGERAESVDVQGDGTVAVGFPGGRQEIGRRLLLATGVVDVLPDLEGLASLWGKTAVHCAYCHGWELRDQPLAALVLRPEDVRAAVQLKGLSDDVIVCLNGVTDLSPEQRAVLERVAPAIQEGSIVRLEGAGGKLERIVFGDGTSVERAGLFLHPSTRQAAPFAQRLGCRMLEDDSVAVDEICRTSVAHVFAAGDMACRHTMSEAGHQVSVAVAEGAVAAIAIDQELLAEDIGAPPPN